MTIVVAEMNRVNEENQNLKSMLKSVSSKHKYLQKHIRSLVQQPKCVEGSQVYYIVVLGSQFHIRVIINLDDSQNS